jgi:predicted metal-binding protein
MTPEPEKRKPIRMSEVALALATRRPSGTTESLTTKENAKGEGLIEALTTYRAETEGWEDWIERHASMHALVSATIRPVGAAQENGS